MAILKKHHLEIILNILYKNYPLIEDGKVCPNKQDAGSWSDYFMAMYQRKEFDIHEKLRVALRKVAYQACPKVNSSNKFTLFK